MRQAFLKRVVSLEDRLAPGVDALDRVAQQIHRSLTLEELQSLARLEQVPEPRRTVPEMALHRRCHEVYINVFAPYSTEQLKQIVANTARLPTPR